MDSPCTWSSNGLAHCSSRYKTRSLPLFGDSAIEIFIFFFSPMNSRPHSISQLHRSPKPSGPAYVPSISRPPTIVERYRFPLVFRSNSALRLGRTSRTGCLRPVIRATLRPIRCCQCLDRTQLRPRSVHPSLSRPPRLKKGELSKTQIKPRGRGPRSSSSFEASSIRPPAASTLMVTACVCLVSSR